METLGTDYQDEYGPQFIEPPEDYDGPLQIVNWNGYEVAISPALNPYFFNAIQNRRATNRSAIIVITGPAGEGKSYLALRLAQILDSKFKILDLEEMVPPREDPSQVPFERSHFLNLIGDDSPLKRGQVILPDEAQYAMGSRRWYEEIQKDLMEAIESVRSQGYVIIIVALHLDLLDVIIRKFVLSFMVHVEKRGLGIVYRLHTPRFEKEMRKRRLGKMKLNLPDYEKCKWEDCLRCRYSGVRRQEWAKRNKWEEEDTPICKTLRAIYERRKLEFVGRRSAQARKKAELKELKDKHQSYSDLSDILVANQHRIRYAEKGTSKGRMQVASIQLILEEETKVPHSAAKAYRIRMYMEEKHPQVALKELEE